MCRHYGLKPRSTKLKFILRTVLHIILHILTFLTAACLGGGAKSIYYTCLHHVNTCRHHGFKSRLILRFQNRFIGKQYSTSFNFGIIKNVQITLAFSSSILTGSSYTALKMYFRDSRRFFELAACQEDIEKWRILEIENMK